MKERKSRVDRTTAETRISLELNLDGSAKGSIKVGIPFLEHMLEQFKKHALLDLDLSAKGDLEVDDHHTVEDVGIVLGQGFHEALGKREGIYRYGYAYAPLDEALTRTVIDFSGRPGLFFNVQFTRARVGKFDLDLLNEFFQGFVNHARATLHIDSLAGRNCHHIAETVFKSFARAVRVAISRDPGMGSSIPSTKGTL